MLPTAYYAVIGAQSSFSYSCYRSCKTRGSPNGKKLDRSPGNGRTYLQIRVRVISELCYNILSINSPGHRQFCLYPFCCYDWSRQKQNKLRWPREDWDDTFSFCFLVAAMRRLNGIENFKRHH